MFEGLDAVLAHYETIEGRVGAPNPIPESTLNKLGYLLFGHDAAEKSIDLAGDKDSLQLYEARRADIRKKM